MLFGGWYYSSSVDLNGDGKNEIVSKSGACDGLIMKLNSNLELEWYDSIKGGSYDTVNSVVETTDRGCIIAGDYMSTDLAIFNKANTLTNCKYADAFIVKYGMEIAEPEVAEMQEITVTNELKQYKITTEIGINSEDVRTGGTITGEYNGEYVEENNIKFVENVKHGYNNEQVIEIRPDNDYYIDEIIINNEKIEFTPDENRTVILPKGYFENVTENKHIIVKFEQRDNLIINKVDETDFNIKLSGAKFGIGTTNLNDLIGAMESSPTSTYKFVKKGDKYESSNANVNNTTSNSYFPIDLTNYTGTFNLSVNTTVSSESDWDLGYATITTTTDVPAYDKNDSNISTSYRFIYTSGSYSNQTASVNLTGGKKYYLHIGYRKNGTSNFGSDKFTINSINLTSTQEIYIEKNIETDAEGKASIKVPNNTKIKITEIEAPYGYVLSDVTQEVEIANSEIKELTITNKKATEEPFTIKKLDKETNEPIQNTKFAVYSISERNETMDFAKDCDGNYIGEANEDGVYETSTDENGKIQLNLIPGYYKAVETEVPEGYLLEENEELRTTYFKTEGIVPYLEINYIEDLVELSNKVNSGTDYSRKVVMLKRTLDFNDDNSYRDVTDKTTYGDYNGNGTIETIKEELTNIAGRGFKPIGAENQFKGIFDGNGFEIKNLYINNTTYSCAGLFGTIENATIWNLSSDGIVKTAISNNGNGYTGGIVAKANNSIIINCSNKIQVTGSNNGSSLVGGIAGLMTNGDIANCNNEGIIASNTTQRNSYAGGITGYLEDNASILNCYNKADISSSSTASTYWAESGGITAMNLESKVINSCNEGNLTSNSSLVNVVSGGITGVLSTDGGNALVRNCYNKGSVNVNGNSSKTKQVGGIAGNMESNTVIENSYNSGNVSSSISINTIGAIAGRSSGTISNTYWLESASSKGVGSGTDKTNPVTQAQMSSEEILAKLNFNNGITNWIKNDDGFSTIEYNNIINVYLTKTSEITVKNSIKQYKINTKVERDQFESKDGGTITGQGEEIYEIVKHNENSIKDILVEPDEGFKIDFIKINGEEISFIPDSNGNVLINKFENMTEDKEIIVKFLRIYESNITLKKLDKFNNEAIPGVKFAIYSVIPNYKTIDFAKDKNGKYIGEQSENGIYTVSTDENGELRLTLPYGYYKAVEIEAADGYIFEENEELRTTYFKTEADIKIEYIEDLVKLSNSVNSGNNYRNVGIELVKTLDFNDDSSYRNASDTETFGDYNGDGNIQSIKEELTNTEGTGFKPIGTGNNVFMGTFDGKGYEIKNIYINSSSNGGLFGRIEDANILNLGIVDGTIKSSSNAGGIVGEIINNAGGVISNCYNTSDVSSNSWSKAGILGYVSTSGKVLVVNCWNSGKIDGNSYTAGGVVGYTTSNNPENIEIINCYNTGSISNIGRPSAGGIVGEVNNTKISNCYNVGEMTVANGTSYGGITYYAGNSDISNCYYLHSVASEGICGQTDVVGKTEVKTEQEMKLESFVDLLNVNKKELGTELKDWLYNENSYPSFETRNNELDKYMTVGNITITNEKIAEVIVHHYLEGTGPEYKDENGAEIPAIVLAEDELLEGKVPDQYITAPNMKIEGYTLIKGVDDEYVIPENASGEYTEEEQHVYYYYTKANLKLTVHHYLEGTEDKVPLGKNEQGEDIVAEDENYYYNEGDHYKTTPSQEVLKSYELVSVVGDEEKDIMQNEEVIYYYKIKKHEITTRVEIPEELNSGRTEKGGSISGEGLAPYETVDYGKASIEDIVVKPDEGYRIKQIRLVSTNEEGVKTESIIYINGKASEKEEIENAEITYSFNVDKSLTLTKFENMTEDKEIIVVFEPNQGKLIVHHYIEGTQEKIYDDQITIDLIGKEVETNPVRVENYVVVEEPADRVGTITKQVQEKVYYYQRQYKVTTDIIKYEEPNEKGEMEEVIGGTISGRGESSYEDILKGRNSQKEIIMTPNEGFEITKITINGEEFDYSELLKEDGSVTLEKEFFKNVDENKHIEVEFRRKTKVHVKYLEDGTDRVLAEEELIDGYVGKDFETERKNIQNYITAKVGSETGITNEAKEAIEPNGQMTKDEITIIYWYEKVPSGILVKHVEKVVTKTINEETGKEEIKVTGVILDEEVIPGYAGESKDTERREYEGYIPAENKEATKGINIAKDENSKQVTMKQDEVIEVVYWYEKEFKITTDVKEHEETRVNPETGKQETVKVKGGSISGEDETEYEKVVRSDDSKKAIKIVPESGYRIKTVTVNGEEIFVKDKISEDGSIMFTKENGYFKNVQEDKHIEVEFEKIPAKVIVHYLLQGTGPEYGNEEVMLADEDTIVGTVNGKYITMPNMDIEGYTLIKDENGEYILPENKTGIFTEKDTHVYYYYTKDPLELIVHHYLEGTKEKLADDEHYYYDEGTHYKTNPSEEVLESYELVKVVGDEEKDITKNEEVIYYYKIKKYEIITRVEIPEEELNSGRTEKGGTISGEDKTPYETVDYGKASVEDIIIKPDEGYRIRQIRLVSTSEENVKKESIIYGENKTENAEITYKENLDGSLILTKFGNMTEDKEVIVIFEPIIGKVIVHHYIEGTTEKISDDEITEDLVGTKVETKPVNKENYVVVQEPEDKNIVITEDTQEKTYYYQRQYKVTTDIIKYEEPDENGKMKEVIGGTISGKGEKSYEDILKGRDSQKEIAITPKEGFEIVKITINGKEFDYSELLKENGSVTLPKEFFKNVEENKHVEVEFRRKTKVHVKYLEVETKKELTKEELINGYVGKDFETERKNIPNYKTAKLEVSELGITNEKEEAIGPNGKMTKDEITIIYWYEKIPAGIIVKHIEKVTTKTINEETGKEEITITGVLLDEEEIKGKVGEEKTTNRKEYEGYIPAENKEASKGINVGKEENSKKVTLKENEVIEIIYWYEKEFKITTDVIEHKEKVVNPETGKEETVKVKGGSIFGEDEKAYEKVVRSNDSTKEIKILPDKGYRIKQILINEKEIIIDEKVAEDGSITLKAENGYFTNMQEDKHIKVEFEKIPAKVIVKYKDSYTKESIEPDKVINGYVDDKYNETRPDIKNYITAEPEPENSTGTMTEETITITYWYTREFKITTDVKEHEEKVINSATGKEEKVKVKGGSITGEDEEPYEIVTRGETSTKAIIIKPQDKYRIKSLTINGKEIEIKDLLKNDNTLELPFFENMQEDKHIVVEFEKIPAKVIVKYLEEGTEKPIYKTEDGKEYEEINGYVNDKYETKEKEIPYYELVKEKYPNNNKGSMTEEDTIVKYYYKKLLFNMKIEKEIGKIQLNGETVEVTDKNKQKLEIEYKELKETKLEITYKIKVTNTEKVEGIAIIEEMLPNGFEFVKQEDTIWKEKDGKYILTTEVINPGETKEYEITLKWNPEETNKGQKVNTAKIANTANIPEYEETTLDDNEDTAIIEVKLNKTIEDILDMPKTGQTRIIYITAVLVAGTCIGAIILKKNKGNKK